MNAPIDKHVFQNGRDVFYAVKLNMMRLVWIDPQRTPKVLFIYARISPQVAPESPQTPNDVILLLVLINSPQVAPERMWGSTDSKRPISSWNVNND